MNEQNEGSTVDSYDYVKYTSAKLYSRLRDTFVASDGAVAGVEGTETQSKKSLNCWTLLTRRIQVCYNQRAKHNRNNRDARLVETDASYIKRPHSKPDFCRTL